jgi:hypothetical protein
LIRASTSAAPRWSASPGSWQTISSASSDLTSAKSPRRRAAVHRTRRHIATLERTSVCRGPRPTPECTSVSDEGRTRDLRRPERLAFEIRRGGNPDDLLSSEGGSQRRVGAGNADPRFAGGFRVSGGDRVSRARFRLCRETSRMPASARQSQNVPVSYPRSAHISSGQATTYAHLQGFSRSPLTDSNRRPPPYHGGALPAELRGRSRQSSPL